MLGRQFGSSVPGIPLGKLLSELVDFGDQEPDIGRYAIAGMRASIRTAPKSLAPRQRDTAHHGGLPRQLENPNGHSFHSTPMPAASQGGRERGCLSTGDVTQCHHSAGYQRGHGVWVLGQLSRQVPVEPEDSESVSR